MLSLAVNNLLLFLLFLLFLLILLVVVVLVVERTVGSLWCSAISFPTQLCFQRRCGPSFSLPIDSRVLLFFENGGCQGNSFAFTFLTNALSSQMPPPSSSNTHTHTHTHTHIHTNKRFLEPSWLYRPWWVPIQPGDGPSTWVRNKPGVAYVTLCIVALSFPSIAL